MSRSTRSSSASALVRACTALAAAALAATLAGCSDDGVAAGPPATVTVTATVAAETSPAADRTTTGAADGEGTGEQADPAQEVEPPGGSERIGDFVDVSPDSGFSGYPVFESPSGNLACAVHDDGGDGGPGAGPFVECLAFEATWSVPEPGDCDLDWADNQLALTTDEVHAGGCRGDTFLSDDQTTLQYGEGWDTGRIACVSRQEDVTCQSAGSGRGFRISRDSYTVF